MFLEGVKKMKKIRYMLLTTLVVFSFSAFNVNPVSGMTFDELAENYRIARDQDLSADNLMKDLISVADKDKNNVELWRSLWYEEVKADKRTANALLLVRRIFPDGDTSRWDEVSGFFYPGVIPSTLAGVDAVYSASLGLINMEMKGSDRLARNLMNSLLDSSRAKIYFFDTAPYEYTYIANNLSKRGYFPDYGDWPEADISGKLPLASPVRGRISSNLAAARNLVFLNASAGIVNNGAYAWDREKGMIYRVIDREDNNLSSAIIFRY